MRVNPHTGTARIFPTRRDAERTTDIYRRLPVLVDRSTGQETKAWPVKSTSMFPLTNASRLFHTRDNLEERMGRVLLAATDTPARREISSRCTKARWYRRTITGPSA